MVLEDARRIDALVRGAAKRHAESSAGWASSFHWSDSFSIAAPTRTQRALYSIRKFSRDSKQSAARIARTITRRRSLAFEDDRRALMHRLARMPENCVAIRFDGSSTSATELLHRLEDALLLPYSATRSRQSHGSSTHKHKLQIARVVERFCDRARLSKTAEVELRAGYREISEQLSAFGL